MNIDDCFSRGLLKRTRPSKDKAKRSLEIAEGYLKKALDNLKMGHIDVAVTLCYRAMFHAARAVLFNDGVKERSHVCMIVYLKHTYPELRKSMNTLDSYRRTRHAVVYGLDVALGADDAEIALEVSKDFVSEMKNFLGI